MIHVLCFVCLHCLLFILSISQETKYCVHSCVLKHRHMSGFFLAQKKVNPCIHFFFQITCDSRFRVNLALEVKQD